jgi:hypothetical protein
VTGQGKERFTQDWEKKRRPDIGGAQQSKRCPIAYGFAAGLANQGTYWYLDTRREEAAEIAPTNELTRGIARWADRINDWLKACPHQTILHGMEPSDRRPIGLPCGQPPTARRLFTVLALGFVVAESRVLGS